MFVDMARIYVKGGDGGRGSNSMRREKYIPLGGPWGGDGGRGGDVIFAVESGLRTLVDFRYQHHFKAERGEPGGKNNRSGESGEDLVVRVPPGTVVKDADSGELVADLTAPGQRAIVAKGGRGGRGNTRFASAKDKAPTYFEYGEPGQERWLQLELKLLADAGLVGYPNAGKSTLLSRVSAARPKIGNYPFTTITPNLGVVELGERSFVLADIPGLIEGAHSGQGLGHEFLRHVERTRVIVHVLDGAGTEGREPLQDFVVVQRELALYNEQLANRPVLVAFNKMDLPDAQAAWPQCRDWFAEQGLYAYAISGVTGEGIGELLEAIAERIALAEPLISEPVVPETAERVYRAEDRLAYEVRREGPVWVVSGNEIERLVAMTMWENEGAVRRFQRLFRGWGIENALERAGARAGDTVEIRGRQFEFSPETIE